ncbi:MAG: anaerobic ribonucleoside-triphosphate reductase activating protein [Piscirickettsiaceae bacterium]|nr:anaerobic ribonucleoside-triphosphate reductase activating protein [Piscirickettsiaceae bacterium]
MHLNIGGMTPFTTIDFPGHLAAVVFLQGCAWRCAYCQNPHLLKVDEAADDWEMLRCFLEKRRGLLDGVVFSGGEPLLQSGLSEAIAAVKDMGFKVALHTAGGNPQRLSRCLPLLDWVGLDVKTTFTNYADLTGIEGSGKKVRESLKLLLESGIDYEVRTTVDPNFFAGNTLLELAKILAAVGVKNYALQQCRAVEDYDFDGTPFVLDGIFINTINAMFPKFTLRTS